MEIDLFNKISIQKICIVIIITINLLFLQKYLIRINQYALIFVVIYGIVQVLLFIYLKDYLKIEVSKKYYYIIFLTLAVIQAMLLIFIDINSLNIDRWSVITSFLDSLFKGDFPYLAKSHLNNPPGPFPIYYLLALPFYLIGEIGLFSLFGIFIFLKSLEFDGFENKSILIIILLITSSVFIWYELAVRSTIFVNMAIAIFYFTIISKVEKFSIKNLIIYGIIGGLLLSTRGIMIFILIIFFSYIFLSRKEWINFIIVLVFIFLGFIITLFPFVVWDWPLFLKYNPITLQVSFIPKIYIILFTLLAFLIGFLSKNKLIMMGLTGVFLFVVVSIPFLTRVLNSSLVDAVINDGFDISYFLFSTPFLFFALIKNDK